MLTILRAFLAASILTSCVTSGSGVASAVAPPVDRQTACDDQARAWCARAGYPDSPGCRVVYMHDCTPSGPGGTIDADDQHACMQAIADNPNPTVQPMACTDTWF